MRQIALVLAAAIAFVAVPHAQTKYPKAVVMLTTHSSPGGGSDVFLREMGPYLSRILGVSVVVDNLQGGSGARALNVLAKARPDGGLFYATTPTMIYTSLLSRPASTYRDLEPIVNIFYDPEVLYTASNSRFKTLKDVLSAAKTGKGRWGAANPASLERQVLERLKLDYPAIPNFPPQPDLSRKVTLAQTLLAVVVLGLGACIAFLGGVYGIALTLIVIGGLAWRFRTL
jgi:tripartite-type tricarboxylate transporter receptor subunit TctC